MLLDSTKVSCPYCGELIELLLEPWDEIQQYYEDCQVCCQPILIKISPGEAENQAIIHCYRADETP